AAGRLRGTRRHGPTRFCPGPSIPGRVPAVVSRRDAMAELTPDSVETQRLLEQIHAGDRQAFERLFAQYPAALRQFVAVRLDGRLRARVDPSDVVQETQMEAFCRLDDFLARRPMPFHLWLRKTAYERVLKVCRAHLATARRAVQREVALPDGSSLQLARQLLAGGDTPSQQFDRPQLARRIRQAVGRLPDAEREVLVMRHFEGLSNLEVAQLLEVDPSTVSKRHGRALLLLRQSLLADSLTESQL